MIQIEIHIVHGAIHAIILPPKCLTPVWSKRVMYEYIKRQFSHLAILLIMLLLYLSATSAYNTLDMAISLDYCRSNEKYQSMNLKLAEDLVKKFSYNESFSDLMKHVEEKYSADAPYVFKKGGKENEFHYDFILIKHEDDKIIDIEFE